jgi:hypothetical protein
LPKDYTYGFLKRSRVVCNFIEREVLAQLKFNADGFKRISISLCSIPRASVFVNSADVACVEIPFDRDVYDHVARSSLCEYYIGKIKEGVVKAACDISVPVEAIFAGVEQFVAGEMINQWLHVKRIFKVEGLVAFLRCELTTEAFRLTLEVQKHGFEVVKDIVLVTDPDENVFEYKLGDVKIIDGQLVVLAKRGGHLWSKALADLERARL